MRYLLGTAAVALFAAPFIAGAYATLLEVAAQVSAVSLSLPLN